MRWIVKLRRRLQLLLARDRVEADMREEMATHLRLAQEAYEREGLDPAAAEARARAEFGSVGRHQEEARDTRGGRLVDDVRFDLRYAFRSLRRAPGHTIAVTLILATAIAGAAVALSLVRAYLLRPLPVPEAHRLVSVLGIPFRGATFFPDLQAVDWTQGQGIFEETASWDLDALTIVQAGQPPEMAGGAWVTSGYFTLLGVTPALGRPFSEEDYVPGAGVALISDALWRRRFGADPAVIGTTVRMHSGDRPEEETLVTIVGVLPPFAWTIHRFNDVLLPLSAPRQFSLARLPAGLTPEEAERRLTDVVRSQVAVADSTWHMSVVSTQADYAFAIRPALRLLTVAALLMLLLAEASVGALLVARGSARVQELALRRALGAEPGRLVRQLGVEALVLFGFAFGLGLLGAHLLGASAALGLQQFGGPPVPGGVDAVRPDGVVTLLLATVTVIPFLALALAPLASLAKVPASDAMSAARISGGRRLARTRQVLVTVQVAVAIALLAQGAVLLQSVRAMQRADLGFLAEGVLKGFVLMPREVYPDAATRAVAVDRVLQRVQSVPGVQGAASVFPWPFRQTGLASMECDGCPTGEEAVRATPHTISPTYHDVMGIPLLQGRTFDARDGHDAPPVAIVSAGLARRLWPTASPIGQRIRTSTPGGNAPWLNVVGVVGDVRKSFTDSVVPDLYRPYAQAPMIGLALMVRSSVDLQSLERPIRLALAEEHETLTIAEVEPVTTIVANARGQASLLALFVSGAGLLAFGLTVAGLYAVIGYLVGQRRREFAVRLALGAEPRRIAGVVLRDARGMVALGAVLGLGLALAAGRLTQAWLLEISPSDPRTLAAVLALVGVVVLGALLAPARRAARVDPAQVLRDD